MGKFIKYFDTDVEFAKYWNFEDWPTGPDGYSPLVAYLGQRGIVVYSSSDVSNLGFESYIEPTQTEFAYDEETVSIDFATGLFYLELVTPGDTRHFTPNNNGTWKTRPFGGINETPFDRTVTLTANWYEDENRTVLVHTENYELTQEADPDAEPMRLIFDLQFTSDGQSMLKFGNRILKQGEFEVILDPNGTATDITNDLVVSGKRVGYVFPSAGTFNVRVQKTITELSDNALTVGDWFAECQATNMNVYTNYPDYAEECGFSFNTPWMSTFIDDFQVGEGAQHINGSLFMTRMSQNPFTVTLDDSTRLPVPDSNPSFFWPANGTLRCYVSAENYDLWVNFLTGKNWTIVDLGA